MEGALVPALLPGMPADGPERIRTRAGLTGQSMCRLIVGILSRKGGVGLDSDM